MQQNNKFNPPNMPKTFSSAKKQWPKKQLPIQIIAPAPPVEIDDDLLLSAYEKIKSAYADDAEFVEATKFVYFSSVKLYVVDILKGNTVIQLEEYRDLREGLHNMKYMDINFTFILHIANTYNCIIKSKTRYKKERCLSDTWCGGCSRFTSQCMCKWITHSCNCEGCRIYKDGSYCEGDIITGAMRFYLSTYYKKKISPRKTDSV